MRFFVIFCLTCLILSVTLFATLISIPSAHAQDCQPAVSTTSTPAVPPPSPTTSIVINEILLLPVHAQLYCTTPPTSQSSTDNLPAGPWIELYNTVAQPLQLTHVTLDSGLNTNPFTLATTSIPAHGFIVVFPSTNKNFMSTFGLTLRLMLNGSILDQVAFPISLLQDTSYARITDGSLSWQITPNTTNNTIPTIGESNNIALTAATPKTQKKSTSKATSQTPKKTSTPKSTSDQTSNQLQSSSSSSSTQTSVANTTTPQIQPNWQEVRLPTRVATFTASEQTTPDLAATITPIASSPDTLKKIALSLLTIALASALWWCRKLFIKI